jgi:hypothetical protein
LEQVKTKRWIVNKAPRKPFRWAKNKQERKIEPGGVMKQNSLRNDWNNFKTKMKIQWSKMRETGSTRRKSEVSARERAEDEFRKFQRSLDEKHPKQDNAAVQKTDFTAGETPANDGNLH